MADKELDDFYKSIGYTPKAGPNVVGDRTSAGAPNAVGATTSKMAAPEKSKAADPDLDSFYKDVGYTPKNFSSGTPSVSITTTPTQGSAGVLGVRQDPNGMVSTFDPSTGEVQQQFTPEMWARREQAIADARTSGVSSFAQGGVSGVPIAGPYLADLAKKGAAVTRMIQNDTPYSQERENVDAIESRLVQEHPYANLAGNLTGAGATYAALGATPAGPYLGMGSAPLRARMLAGGLSGGGIGIADAAAREQNPFFGGMLGVLGGTFAAPIGEIAGAAGSAAASGGSRLWNRLTNPVDFAGVGLDKPAANLLAKGLEWDTPQAVQQSVQNLGHEAVLADAGPSLRGIAGGLAAKPDASKSILGQFLEGRRAQTTSRLQAALDTNLGPAEDPAQVSQNIRDYKTRVDNANYTAVHNNAPPVDVSGVVATIDRHLETATGAQRSALQKWRTELVRTPERTAADGSVIPEDYHDNSRIIHNLRQDIDTTINYGDPGLGIAPGALNREQRSVGAVRGAIDDVLKNQVPGMAHADAASAALARRVEAVERGTQLLDSGKTAVPPGTYAATRQAMPLGEQLAENKGIRGELDRLTGVKRNDLEALNQALQGEGGWNTDKLRTAFGNQAADAISAEVNRRNAFRDTYNTVLQNSQTAAREGAKELLKETDPREMNLKPANATGLALQAGKSLIYNPIRDILLHQNSAARNEQAARALVAQGSARDAILNRILQVNAQNAATSAFAAPVGNAANYGVNALLRTPADQWSSR